MKARPDAHIRLLLAALVVGMAPHVVILPTWIILWCLCSWGYILFIDHKRGSLPPGWIRGALALIAFSMIIATSRGRFDSDSGIGLLCLMASLKPFEIKGYRDRMITLFLSYFMVAAGLFFSTTLEMTVYLFVSVIVITGLLILVNYPDIRFSSGMKLSMTLTVQALPLALILFVVFPRIQGSLWGIQQRKSGLTSLSSTLSPGSLSELAKNESVAFRVSFETGVPRASQLYWRGLVFQSFDGRRWRMDHTNAPAKILPVSNEALVRYDVVMEPHNEHWLFVLDFPAVFSNRYSLLENYTLRSGYRITAKTRYAYTSTLVTKTGEADTWDWVSRSLPPKSNPRARSFAKTLRENKGSDQGFVDGVLEYIHQQEFYYTLTPPLLGKDSVDDFLFNTRKGYCEHYASAFVFLMRAAGIPARIVGGYLGGEFNPYGNYLIVRQSQAHVWAEVWMEKQGWTRVDPTAAIANERVEAGVSTAGGQDAVQAGTGKDGNGFFSDLADNLQLGWDSLNYFWYSKVIGYTAQSQKRFLERFGLSLDSMTGWIKIAVMALALIGGLTLLFYLGLALKHREKDDPILHAYRIFLKKLEKVGIDHLPHEGPEDFAARAMCLRKDLGRDVAGITRQYVLLRYGGKNMDRELELNFKNQVKGFRPKKSADH